MCYHVPFCPLQLPLTLKQQRPPLISATAPLKFDNLSIFLFWKDSYETRELPPAVIVGVLDLRATF